MSENTMTAVVITWVGRPQCTTPTANVKSCGVESTERDAGEQAQPRQVASCQLTSSCILCIFCNRTWRWRAVSESAALFSSSLIVPYGQKSTCKAHTHTHTHRHQLRSDCDGIGKQPAYHQLRACLLLYFGNALQGEQQHFDIDPRSKATTPPEWLDGQATKRASKPARSKRGENTQGRYDCSV